MATIFRDKVTIGSATFNDPSARPVGADQWAIDILDGWRATPDLDALVTPWGGQVDGGVASAFFPARPKYLTVSGYVTARSRAEAELLWDVLVRDAFPRNRELTITRHEGVPKWMRVRRAGPIEPPQDLGDAFRFTVDLVAADPFKYAMDRTIESAGVAGVSNASRTYQRVYPLTYNVTGGGEATYATITNTGTAPAYPVVVIHGPLPEGGWRLENSSTGESISFDLGLNTGDELVIDFRQQIAELNGNPVTSSVVGTFWRVEGTAVVRLYSTFDPEAGFDISIYSAWE